MGGETTAGSTTRSATTRWVLLWAAAALAVAVFVADHIVTRDRLLDLEVYRMGGRAVLDGTALYELRYPEGWLPFTYPPFAAVLFAPLALLGTDPATAVWTALSLAALGRCCLLVARAAPGARPATWSAGQGALALFVLALFLEPVVSTLTYGQVNLVVLWLVLEDLLGGHRRAGALIGVATGWKLLPGVFIGFLLITGRAREGLRAAAVAAGTVVVGFVVLPGPSWTYWTGTGFDADRIGTVDRVRNQSFTGAVSRLLGQGEGRALALALGALVLVLALVVARRLWLAGDEVLAIGTVAVGGLLASPVSWTHHWVWLVVVVPALVDRARRDSWAWPVLAGLLAFSLQWILDENRAWIWRLPDPDGPGDALAGLQQVVGNSFVLAGCVFLAYVTWTAWRRPAPGPAVDPVSAGAACSARRTPR